MIWGPLYPSVLRSAQRGAGRTNTSAPPGFPLLSKGDVAEVTARPGSRNRDSPTPGHITCGTVLLQSHLSSSCPAFILRYSDTDQVPPHRASNPCTFYKPPRGHRSHTAAPCLLLRDRGPWPRFFPRFFYISVLIYPRLEEATHLLQARGERRMKK